MAVPVMSVAEMRAWEDSSWAAGIAQAEVIAQVGKIVAHRALQMTRSNDRILVLAGKGHNGDDARCAQPHLTDRRVRLLNVHDPAAAAAELETSLRKCPALIIDGLFGIGLNRPLSSAWIELIEKINQSGVPVLAVDVPSGLDAETGETHGMAVCAAVTLTLAAPKPGLLRTGASHFVGHLELAQEIGLAPRPEAVASELFWTTADDFVRFPPSRRSDSHKGSHGHAVVAAGSLGYHGAAVLSATGALRGVPGLVSVYCAEEVYVPVASQLQAAMAHPWKGQPLPENCSAVLFGPGLAASDLPVSWREFTNEIWQSFPMPVVVDASALDWIKPGPTVLNSRRILTPHPGEAARLLGVKPAAVQDDRTGALREISGRFGNCWVILKGRQTLIGRNSGEIYVNSTGNALLAQGGSGDVLAGYLTGLLAQPRLQAQPLRTIRYAVWEHGAAADRLSSRQTVWTIADLLPELGNN